MEPITLFATLGLFVFGGLATYTISERDYRFRWQRFGVEPVDEQHSPFRAADGPAATRTVLTQARAPRTIRRTALWSIYMGQMTVPGGLLGLLGLLVGGLGLVGIPGMILGVRIWRLGYAMLRREPGAATQARKLARFAAWLNFVAIAIGLVVFAIAGQELLFLPVVLMLYGAVSLAHANAMIRCADLLDADEHAQAKARARHAPGYAGVHVL